MGTDAVELPRIVRALETDQCDSRRSPEAERALRECAVRYRNALIVRSSEAARTENADVVSATHVLRASAELARAPRFRVVKKAIGHIASAAIGVSIALAAEASLDPSSAGKRWPIALALLAAGFTALMSLRED